MLVLVVEDEPAHQTLLRHSFEARGMDVVVAGTGAEAMRLLAVQDPQLVILDLGLPDIDGITLCRRIRASVQAPIIVSTADAHEERMIEAFDFGADDYVLKNSSVELLMARVRVALRHASDLASAIQQTELVVGDLVVDVPAHLALAGGQAIDLSPRQFRLLTALMRNAGMILTHKQLAMVTRVDGDEGTGADGLRGAMSHLRKRIGTGPDRPRIVTEPHIGYRLVARSD